MITVSTNRPRNVDAPRAAAILYGDWGTSKAYVIGLAFAVAGYASFWLIAAMCVLTALVGLNYMVICRLYPDGGGVYASVRHRSEVISIVGAFLLIADYLVTAAISALSGLEAIANATGVMKLDPGSTDERPSVVKTSTPAILIVMIEVGLFTALLGLAMHALGGLQTVNGDVNAPGAEGVRDYMLRYMGQIFVGGALGAALGHAFGFIVSIVFAMLL